MNKRKKTPLIERVPIKFLSFETKLRKKTLLAILAIIGLIIYFCFVHSWHYDKRSGIRCGGKAIILNDK